MRLLVLQRDKFACTNCGSPDKTLHVHHLAYKKGRDPWEYDPEMLVTLCEECHKQVEETQVRQCEELLLIFKTELKDSFIRGCFLDIMKRMSDLGSFTYSLWEATDSSERKERLNAFMQQIFNEKYGITILSDNEFEQSLKENAG